MSNVIKAYSVRYDDIDKITINNHFNLDKKLETDRKERKIISNEEPGNGEFVEGLQAVVVEEIPSGEEISKKAEQIIEDANNEAQSIIENAKKEAEKIKQDAFLEAQKKGYDEGNLQAKSEAQKLKAEYEEKSRKLQKEYDDMTLSLEPQMAGLVADLVEKITGILVKDNMEVILYLINKAIKNLDQSDSYTIKVSKEDIDYVSLRKDLLLEAVGRDASVNIIEDVALTKNQCMIETNLKVINCSLDEQLTNLLNDLRIIGGI